MTNTTITNTSWCIEELTGYKPKTTFWQDFSIADAFGIGAVKDAYNRAFDEWKSNAEYLAELALVLNRKIWQHYESNEPLARVYDELWRAVDDYACTNLTGEDLAYYYRTTD